MLYASVSGFRRPLSKLIFGTAGLRDTPQHREFLDNVLREGCDTFDSARVYANGEAEISLGKWIRERQLHKDITVISKAGHPSDRSRLGYSDLLADIDATRHALGLDTIDAVLLHRDDPLIPVEEIVSNVNTLIGAGKTRVFGVSNWEVDRIVKARSFARQQRLQEFSLSSSNFSLAPWNRAPWPGCGTVAGPSRMEDREWYATTQFPLLAWSSLAAGFFSEKGTSRTPVGAMRTWAEHVYSSKANSERLARVTALARKRQATAAQIALAYVLNQEMNTFAIISTWNRAHFRQNADALAITLSDSERRWLNLESNLP